MAAVTLSGLPLALLAFGPLALLTLAWWRWRRAHDEDLRALQHNLRERELNEQRLELALEASDAALWEWHIPERRLVLSARYYSLLGYAPGAFEPTLANWRALVHPDDWEPAMAIVRAHLQAPAGLYVNEYRMRDAQGQWRWVMARGRVVRQDAEGEPLLMVGTHIDVHEARLQQRAANESRERFEKIYETTPDAMGITRVEDGLYIDINSAFLTLTGYRRDEVIGRTSTEVGIWADAEQRSQLIAEFRRTGQVDSMELVARHKDGQLLTGLMSVRPLAVGGDACMLFIFRDITERRRLQHDAEAARAEMAAAAAASRAKTEFLSRMSHELRTPLNAVLGFAQLLQGATALGERERGHLQAILQAGWHLLNLIDDVLDIARIESGHLQLEHQAMELQPVVAAALELVRNDAEAAGVTLEPPTRAALAQRVVADPVRLRQALVNLLSNAIKYNHRGGRVSLYAKADGQFLSLRVSDTGMGMSAQQMAHLFEPFNRLGRERDSIDGTGIGLVLTRHLMELMGGELAISSAVNVGTTATLRLRLGMASPPEPLPGEEVTELGAQLLPPGAVTGGAGPRATVLYIEDNPTNQLIVREMLAPWEQVDLHLAACGEEGLRLAGVLRPELILLDMRLPDLDGLQVLRRLKSDPRLAGIKVVALSASAMAEDVERARLLGALEYWTKPLRLDHFLDDMQRVLS